MSPGLRVSVIVPAFNAAGTISRAVDSALAQARPPDEIVVIDDGSPDADSLAGALARYGERVTLLRGPNGGAAAARNRGIDRAAGDLLAFLDADDYWEPDHLRQQAAVFERFPEVGLSCALAYFQSGGQPKEPQANWPAQIFDRPFAPRGSDALLQATRTWTSTVVIRRSVLGPDRFATDLTTAEDRDLWLRIISRTQVYMHSARLATGVLEPGSLSRSDVDVDCRNMLRVVRRYPDILSSAEMRRWEAYVYRRWASVHLADGDGRRALSPGLRRLVREPWSAEAIWVVAKAGALALRPRSKRPPRVQK
jgi:glycosyltransferase involved in cell wall biosynthesis